LYVRKQYSCSTKLSLKIAGTRFNGLGSLEMFWITACISLWWIFFIDDSLKEESTAFNAGISSKNWGIRLIYVYR
jgi:hypothetical protein